MSAVVPASVRLAAKRGFVRTATQSLSAAIPTTAIAITLTADWALSIGLGALSAVGTAVLAGTASYLSIVSKGIPEDYELAAIDQSMRRASE